MSNHSYSSVGYYQFVVDSYVYLSDNFHYLTTTDDRFIKNFFEDVVAAIRNNDPLIFIYITLLTVGWTMLRYVFTNYLIKPLGKRYKLPESKQDKLPECAWNFFYYFSSWLLTAYILIVKEKGAPLLRPELMWSEWKFTNALPFEYLVMYVLQLSFYLHSIYAILAMDRWRKDSVLMMLHHMIAFLLIFFGYSVRGHQAGAVVLFLHDICDVFLEGSKFVLYFKIQDKKKHPIFELIGNVGFLMFCIVWFCSRLYAFPLRLIWSCTTLMARMNVYIPLTLINNLMLYLLLMMNLFWTTFIVRLMYQVATGTDELKDLREYERNTELDDMSSDSKGIIKNHSIDSNEDSINKNDSIKSTSDSHYDLRKRNKTGVRSN